MTMITEADREWVMAEITKINQKMEWVREKSKDKIPYTTMGQGEHDDFRSSDRDMRMNEGINWWTNGFWGGMLWLLYHETKDERYAKIAEKSEIMLDQCFVDYYGLHHDVGFMWLPTAVADYRLTGSQDARRRGLHAASMLAGRFNPAGRFIRAWNSYGQNDNTGWAIIDCMMNLPLLYWASEETKDPRFRHIARMHANTVIENFVREDGSCEHIVEFDPENGGKVNTYGGQGYEKGSSWTRGQAWGLYGFTLSYIHTKEDAYLDTAKKIARYFILNIPDSGHIPIDFKQPAADDFEDSTAAAIAACGLIELARCTEKEEREFFLQAAVKMLKALSERRCNWSSDCDCILEKCSEAYHSRKHLHIIYGDYYYIEAMFKLADQDVFLW